MAVSERENVRQIQKRIAAWTNSVGEVFSSIDTLLKELDESMGQENNPDGYVVKASYLLALLKEAEKEISECSLQLGRRPGCQVEDVPADYPMGSSKKNRIWQEAGDESASVSMVQADQILIAIEKEKDVLEQCLDSLRELFMARKQSENVDAVKSITEFQDALRRYSNGQEQNS